MTSSTPTPPGTDGPPLWKLVAAFATIYIVWGSTYLAIKWAVEGFPPFLMAGARFLTAGCIIYALARRHGAPRVEAAHWKSAAVSGALLLLAGNGCVAWAAPLLPSGAASLFIATTPLWIVSIDAAFGGRRPSLQIMFGLVMGCTGLVLLALPRGLALGEGIDPHASLALIIGPICWAAGSIYSRDARMHPSAFLSAGLQQLIGGALLILVGLSLGESERLDLLQAPLRAWLAFLYLLTVGSLVAYTAYTWLLRNVSAAKVATYAYVNPVVALLLGWLVNKESLGIETLIAAAVILAAVVLITLDRQRREGRGKTAEVRRDHDSLNPASQTRESCPVNKAERRAQSP